MVSTVVSDCHSYSLKPDGKTCNWCGGDNGTHDRHADKLLNEIEAALCDWNRCSQLDTTDLQANVHKVAVLIYKERERLGMPQEAERG